MNLGDGDGKQGSLSAPNAQMSDSFNPYKYFKKTLLTMLEYGEPIIGRDPEKG